MKVQRMRYSDALRELPPEWPNSCIPEIQKAVRDSGSKVVVLDDDPTGTQTVHGVPVLTEWSTTALRKELADSLPAFYILTNSRSLHEKDAENLAGEIGRNLLEASRESGRKAAVISRSDSTLRGHFPAEVTALARALQESFDAWLLIPFFQDGGRFTFKDVHYLREGDWLTPVNETESARDGVFGYQHANLRHWVEEKTRGEVCAENVQSVSVEEIRTGGPQQVARRLKALTRAGICVINAMSMRDLEVFTLGLLHAEAEGRQFLYRTAASFVPLRAGLKPSPLLETEELDVNGMTGGLIVAGSYVPRTTAQLDNLLAQPGLECVELDAEALSRADRSSAEVERASTRANCLVRSGTDVVIYTSRRLISGHDMQNSLAIGQSISDGIVSIVRSLSVRPRYLLAKGGITSSDVAAKALGVKRALVLGQILSGVPVWRLGPESRYPGLDYIVFPGNVGDPEALSLIVNRLKSKV